MIKLSVKKWAVNEEMALLEQQIKESFDVVYDQFWSDKISLPTPRPVQQQRRLSTPQQTEDSNLL